MVSVSGRPWLSLSNEVLGKICEQFCPHCAGEDCLGRPASDFAGPEYFGTLDALTKVNVRIGRQAQLVRHHFFSGSCHSLPKFVRVLVDRPALAAQVRVVRLGDDDQQPCVLDGLDGQDVAKFWAAVMPEFCVPSSPGEMVSAGPPVELVELARQTSGANARFNAMALLALAKGITSIAVQGDWARAVFSNLTDAAAIVARFSDHRVHPSAGPSRSSTLRCADFTKFAFLEHKPCPLTWTEIQAMVDLLSFARLREIRFVSDGDCELVGYEIVEKLADAKLATYLTRLEIDTSQSGLFIDEDTWSAARGQFYTIPSLADFPNLRHLSLSADSIYFPSQYPRVLLRDRVDEDAAMAMDMDMDDGPRSRLVDLLPVGLRTLKITGIYAIHTDDVKDLARACINSSNNNNNNSSRFGALRKVVLEAGGITARGEVPYPFPRNFDAEAMGASPYQYFEDMAEDAELVGACENDEVASMFAVAGVEYEFDQPEFFFDRFAANWWYQ